MAIPDIAPTKSNLLREKEKLILAQEGFELLERKREILVMELMRRIDDVKIIEREIARRTETAYPTLRRMLLSVGRERAADLAADVRTEVPIEEKTVCVAGMYLPSLEARVPPPQLRNSFMNSFADSDETVLEFTELLGLIARMAGLRSVVWRLAREVRKTQRRVNALEKMVIPESRARKVYIEASLEEREREALFAVKLLKARSAARDGS